MVNFQRMHGQERWPRFVPRRFLCRSSSSPGLLPLGVIGGGTRRFSARRGAASVWVLRIHDGGEQGRGRKAAVGKGCEREAQQDGEESDVRGHQHAVVGDSEKEKPLLLAGATQTAPPSAEAWLHANRIPLSIMRASPQSGSLTTARRALQTLVRFFSIVVHAVVRTPGTCSTGFSRTRALVIYLDGNADIVKA